MASSSDVMHSHGGPCHLLDAAAWKNCKNSWSAEFRSKLEAGSNILGLDMEWAPDRSREQNNKISLMQIAVGDTVWLLRTCQIPLPEVVNQLLLDSSVVKVVAGFDACDRKKLESSFGIVLTEEPEVHGFLDIGNLARECGFISSQGLKKLSEKYGYYIEKKKAITTSNWARSTLSSEQRQYAADDAYFNLLVASNLLKEQTIQDNCSQFRLHAAKCLAQVSADLDRGLREEDCSQRNAELAVFWEELHEAIRSACESSRDVGYPHGKLPYLVTSRGIQFSKEAGQLGISLAKATLEEQRHYFEIIGKDDAVVRARPEAESAPHTQDELNLPWTSDSGNALREWLQLQAGKNLNEVQLKGRLKLLRRTLEGSNEVESSRVVQNLSNLATKTKSLAEVAAGVIDHQASQRDADAEKPASGKLAPSKLLPGSSNKKLETFCAERSVMLRGVPKEWDESDFKAAIVGVLCGADAIMEFHLCPGQQGKGKRKGYVMFQNSETAASMLKQQTVRLAGTDMKAEAIQS